MKNLKLTSFFTFIMFILVISSCKKDDTSPSSSGNFTVNDSIINTPFGFIENNQNSFYIEFADVSEYGGDYNNLAGFQIICTNNNLESKTYTFDPNHTNGLVDAYFSFGGGDADYSDPISGSITISKEGDIYDITYTIKVSDMNGTSIPNGKIITGSFKGKLKTLTVPE